VQEVIPRGFDSLRHNAASGIVLFRICFSLLFPCCEVAAAPKTPKTHSASVLLDVPSTSAEQGIVFSNSDNTGRDGYMAVLVASSE
jgi:hypothetical protein